MNRGFLISLVTAVLLALAATDVYADRNSKVTVCHIPPDNLLNLHTITINEKALSDHLAHGDVPGICDENSLDVKLQILAINDYHGHLEANTPGTINGAQAGGSEYLSAKLNELRQGQNNSLTVAAGDLIGGSPAFSGLFHDEPSVDSLNAMEIDFSSVGNHEFDEGVDELLRMQSGGCHPVDGCYFPDQPYAGADFLWLAANVVNDAGETPLPPYWVESVRGVEVGFIGMTLEATDTLVAAAGIEGWNFLDEAAVANALVPVLKAQGVSAIVVLLHEGGSQTPPPGDVDACVGISGPVVAINDALDPEIVQIKFQGVQIIPVIDNRTGRIVRILLKQNIFFAGNISGRYAGPPINIYIRMPIISNLRMVRCSRCGIPGSLNTAFK